MNDGKFKKSAFVIYKFNIGKPRLLEDPAAFKNSCPRPFFISSRFSLLSNTF